MAGGPGLEPLRGGGKGLDLLRGPGAGTGPAEGPGEQDWMGGGAGRQAQVAGWCLERAGQGQARGSLHRCSKWLPASPFQTRPSRSKSQGSVPERCELTRAVTERGLEVVSDRRPYVLKTSGSLD